jgi:ferric-dicitrate binding protein FerR (iron transport regulator)
MCNRLKIFFRLVLAATLASVPALAGPAVVGLVAGSVSARIEGQPVLPYMVIFADDLLQVKDGAAVVAVSNSSRIALGRDTTAAFQRDTRGVTVILSAGSVSLYHASDGLGLRVQAGSVMVEAAPGFKTLGEITMMDGAVAVKARDGALRVNDGERTMEVAKGKTIAVTPKAARASAVGRSYNVGGGSTGLKAGAVGGAGAPASAVFASEPSPTPPPPSPNQPPCLFPTIRDCQ